MLLDKQIMFAQKQRVLEQERRDLDILKVMNMQGQTQASWANMTGNGDLIATQQ